VIVDVVGEDLISDDLKDCLRFGGAAPASPRRLPRLDAGFVDENVQRGWQAVGRRR